MRLELRLAVSSLAVFAVLGCDPTAPTVAAEKLPPVPNGPTLYGAAFDGENPVVVATPPGREPSVLWRYDGTAWVEALTAVSIGRPKSVPSGVVVPVNEPQGGLDRYLLVRIANGVLTRTPPTNAAVVLGEQSDGTLLVSDERTVWRLAPGATDFETFSTDTAFNNWNGAVLRDDRLLNLTPTGLVLFDRTGVRVSTIGCGELLCAKESLGVGLVGGEPHLVFGTPQDAALIITRVDLANGSLVKVGQVPAALKLGDTTFAAAVVQLAVTERRWYAVRITDYSTDTGWLVSNSLDGAGLPAVVTQKLALGGGLFTTAKAVWSYQPRPRTFLRMAP